MLTLIDRFRMFARAALADDRIGSNEIAVYTMLLSIDNDLLFQEWFGCSDRRLQEMIQVGSVHTITKAKNRLKQLGWIDFKAAGKKTTLYKLAVPVGATDTATECGAECATENTQSATKCATDTATDTATECGAECATENTQSATKCATDTATDTATECGAECATECGALRRQTRQDRQDKTGREDDDAHVRVQACVREQGLPKIPTEVKSAFEGAFRPLAGLKDMERLSCLLEEFGRRGVLFAVVQARERPQGLERIRDPFSWMRTVLLTEPSPSSRAEGAGRASEARKEPRLRDFTHVDPKAYAKELAQKNEELYERSGGDIYGIFGGSGTARES